MNILFNVTGKVTITKYMLEDKATTQVIKQMVYANSAEEAKEKFINHYTSQTEEYEIYYSVSNVTVETPIM
jgi:hypothetical protein